MSFGKIDATTFKYCSGFSCRTLAITDLPFSRQSSSMSSKNAVPNTFREPFGLPFGLPDCPGLKGINPLCFLVVLTVSPIYLTYPIIQ